MYTEQDKVDYWRRASQCAEQARKHTVDMEMRYSSEIAHSVSTSSIFTGASADEMQINLLSPSAMPNAPSTYGTPAQCISVVPWDSVRAVFECERNGTAAKGRTAVLNFASYKYPGGRFMDGSMAQEEALCHKSFLYNVLLSFNDSFYAWNAEHKNRALYMDRAIYSKDIRFFLDEKTTVCDVLTCACPNRTAAQGYCHVSDADNLAALEQRCKFVLGVASAMSVDTLILGAFGCGVFGQDAGEVAECFARGLNEYRFEEVVFAIPDTGAGSRNLEPFAKRFGKHY